MMCALLKLHMHARKNKSQLITTRAQQSLT